MLGRALLVLGLLLCPAVPAAAEAPLKPKLIVTLVVDQFAADLLERYRTTATQGLKRLDQGIDFVNGYQSHAATETCPGHSTILTGRHPAATGIIANEWYDRASGKSVYCVAVPGADRHARGPQNLRVDTLGTWLKASEPGSRVISVSGKDRAAIMLGGHHADAEYWWNDGKGFGSSPQAPGSDAQAVRLARQFNGAVLGGWQQAVPRLWPTDVPQQCRALQRPERFGELSYSGSIPPADETAAIGDPGFAGSLRAAPLLDRLTLRFAAQLAGNLGHGAGTDLLAVSLSATDYIGHRYGKFGPEMCVQVAQLDDALGTFFSKLDALGLSYVVVLTADHGSSDAAERSAREQPGARRVDGRAMIAALNAAVRQSFALEYDPIHASELQELTIDTRGDAALAARIRSAAVAWLKARPEIYAVLTRDQVMTAAPARGTTVDKLSMAERFHDSFDAQRSGDIFVVLPQYVSTYYPRKAGDAAAGHGTPWDYDRRVPILFWWRGIAAQTVTRPIETVDIAPTLAAIAGVRTPQLDGVCLTDVARCEPAPPGPDSD